LKKIMCSILVSLALLCSCSAEVVPEPTPVPHPLQDELAAFHAGFSPSESYEKHKLSFKLLETVIFSPDFSIDDIKLLERENFHPEIQTLHGERGDITY
jgi:hypothetical protein